MILNLLNPRRRSLIRASALVLLSLGASIFLSHFPHNQPTMLLVIPAFIAFVGTVDTLRCMRSRWSLYHGGVLLLLYMDLMALCIILFFLIYPYISWQTASH